MNTETKRAATKPELIDVLLAGIRVSGGYKWRERFPQMSNQDLPAFIAACEAQLRGMARNLAIAEAMLREPAPSPHPRWEEYRRRGGEDA